METIPQNNEKLSINADLRKEAHATVLREAAVQAALERDRAARTRAEDELQAERDRVRLKLLVRIAEVFETSPVCAEAADQEECLVTFPEGSATDPVVTLLGATFTLHRRNARNSEPHDLVMICWCDNSACVNPQKALYSKPITCLADIGEVFAGAGHVNGHDCASDGTWGDD
jgi:hypothetical protein